MMYTFTELRELVFNYKCANGDTLEEVLDFCESIIFDTSYSKEERKVYESLYKILIFARLRLHETKIEQETNINEDPFLTERPISPKIFKWVNSNLGVAKQKANFEYAYNKKRYNF